MRYCRAQLRTRAPEAPARPRRSSGRRMPGTFPRRSSHRSRPRFGRAGPGKRRSRCHGSAHARPSRRRGGGTRTCARARASRPPRGPDVTGRPGERRSRPRRSSRAAARGGRGRDAPRPPTAAAHRPARAGPAPLSWAEPCGRGRTCSAPPCPPLASSPRAGTGAGPVAGLRLSSARAAAVLALSPARPPRPLPAPQETSGSRGAAARRLPAPGPPALPRRAALRAAAHTCRRAERPRRPALPPGCPALPCWGPSGPPAAAGAGTRRRPQCMRGRTGRGLRPEPLASRPAAARRPARGAARGGEAAAPCEKTRRRT